MLQNPTHISDAQRQADYSKFVRGLLQRRSRNEQYQSVIDYKENRYFKSETFEQNQQRCTTNHINIRL